MQPLRPLAPGDWVIESSLAGVFLHEDFVYGAAQPVPGVRYGLVPNLELRGHVMPALLLSAIAGFDAGLVWHGPRVDQVQFHGSADVLVLVDPFNRPAALRGAFNARATAHWEATATVWPFASIDGAVAFDDGDFIPAAGIGTQFQLDPWELSIEARLGAWDERTLDFSQPYLGVAGRGVLYGGLGIGYRL